MRMQFHTCRPSLEPLEQREVLNATSQRFVNELYHELLRREPESSGLAGWKGLLDQGTPPAEVARRIQGSAEYLGKMVQERYQSWLGRAAEPTALDAQVRLLQTGRSIEDFEASILGSPEYFRGRAQDDADRFLRSLYQDGLGRESDPAGFEAFRGQLARGASRAVVADQVLRSTEGRERTVATLYRRFLYRNPEASGTQAWVGLLHGGTRQEVVAAGILGSDEYRTLVSRTDVVLDWNRVLLNAIRRDRTAPPTAARGMAMVHAAMYDAVNAVTRTHTTYKINAVTPAGTSAEAAAAVAAHRVLVRLFPGQVARFDTELALSLGNVPDSTSKIDGIALGRTVADGILADRANDGASRTVTYTPGTDPGDWQRTPPGFQAPVLPQWPQVTPFAMTSATQFRPPSPPALDSAAYATDLNEVKFLGSKNSTTRTPDQTQIALFWADGPGTVTPPGHWNVIARHQALLRGNDLATNARLFALLNLAEADAGIVSWDCKYAFDFWRPVTAIRQADRDGNPQTTPDATWESLIVTPPFPTYTSGHSTFSGGADQILTSVFGPNVGFVDGSDALPGVYRAFRSFADAANEAGRSRIYGGIHFEFDNQPALASGRALGTFLFQNVLRPNS